MKNKVIFICQILAFLLICVILLLVFKKFFIGQMSFNLSKDSKIAIAVLAILVFCLLVAVFRPSFRVKGTQNKVISFRYINNFSLAVAFSVLLLSASFAMINQKIITKKIEPQSIQNSQMIKNPFWDEYEKIAQKYNLDLEFAKFVKSNRVPNFKDNHLFRQKPKSVDVLIIGDSSISWSTILSVSEQRLPNINIKFFAYENLPLNPRTSKMFKILIDYYLKDDAIIIFSNNYYMTRDFKLDEITMFEEMENYILNYEFKNLPSKTQANSEDKSSPIKNSNLLYYKDFSEYIANLSNNLKNYSFDLFSAEFYKTYLEKKLNPLWHNAKMRDNVDFIDFEDGSSIALILSKELAVDAITFKLNEAEKIDLELSPTQEQSIKAKVESIVNLSKHKKVFLLNPFDNIHNYLTDLEFYNRFLKAKYFNIINLGENLDKYPRLYLQAGYHTANTGSVIKSIILADEIKKYLNK